MIIADHEYEFLINTPPQTQGERIIWEGLANKLFIILNQKPNSKNTNKLNTILQLAKQYNIELPNQTMQKGWEFVIDLQKKILDENLTEQQIQEYVNEFARTNSTQDAKTI